LRLPAGAGRVGSRRESSLQKSRKPRTFAGWSSASCPRGARITSPSWRRSGSP